MQEFRKFIENYVTVNDRDWAELLQYCKIREARRGEMLLEEGSICRHLYFLKSGLARFFINQDGQDITKFFTISPYCFTSQRSFAKQQPAKESIEIIESGTLLSIPRQAVYDLFTKLPIWNEFARELIQEVQFFTENILEDLQNQTAEYRYQKMLNDSPDLLTRIPQKHLASFLGIAPQSLSRIRKRIMPQRIS